MGGITMNHSRRMMQTHLNVKNHCLLKLFALLFLSSTLELCAFICNQTSFQNIYTNLNYNNRRLYCLSDRGLYKRPLFTGTKSLILFKMSCFFFSSMFNNLCIYGMADFLYLSVQVSLTLNFSLCLFCIECKFVFLGNIDLNFSTSKHFFANLRQRDSLLFSRD